MKSNTTEIEYRIDKSAASLIDIKAEINKLWDDLKNPKSPVYKDALESGIDVDALPDRANEVLTLEKTGAGLDPFLVSLVVVFAKSAAAAAGAAAGKDIWTRIILPRLLHKFGEGSIVEKDENPNK